MKFDSPAGGNPIDPLRVAKQLHDRGEGCLKESPMKAENVGELRLAGVSADDANAVYDATGVRVRDDSITFDTVLDRLPEVSSGALKLGAMT